MERAVILAQGPVIAPDLLPVREGAAAPAQPAGQRLVSLEELEKEHIRFVLKSTGFHKSRTAQILGIARRTLDRKIEEYRLDEQFPTRLEVT